MAVARRILAVAPTPAARRPRARKNQPDPLRGALMSAIIEATDLHKHYGEVHALDGLNLTAESGRLTALLGPHGAGKTTFISAVATLPKPTSGSLRVAGIALAATPNALRRVIGLAGPYASVAPAMTGPQTRETP